jgi:hypothetical protein
MNPRIRVSAGYAGEPTSYRARIGRMAHSNLLLYAECAERRF